jgi:hypothetical protein
MARVRQRVVTAVGFFVAADQVLELADAVFHLPLLEAAAQDPAARANAECTKLLLSLEALKDVSMYLDSAVVYMQAARILARAGSHLDQAEPAVLQGELGAIARLRTACTVALDAYEVVDFCRGHLSAAVALLDGFAVNAALFEFVEQECDIVGPALSYAKEQYWVARDQAAAARQLLTEAL